MKRGVKKQQGKMGAIRLISGQWRGRKLPVLQSEGLRPTTDRTKETLFNWLMPFIRGRTCLDTFAGSGSLGFEALSRYAEHVTFLEKDTAAAAQLKQNISLLDVSSHAAHVHCADSLQKMTELPRQFDLIFIDPPFNQNLIPSTLQTIERANLLASKGLVYIECELPNAGYSVPANWLCVKDKQTKQVSFRLFEKQD